MDMFPYIDVELGGEKLCLKLKKTVVVNEAELMAKLNRLEFLENRIALVVGHKPHYGRLEQFRIGGNEVVRATREDAEWVSLADYENIIKLLQV